MLPTSTSVNGLKVFQNLITTCQQPKKNTHPDSPRETTQVLGLAILKNTRDISHARKRWLAGACQSNLAPTHYCHGHLQGSRQKLSKPCKYIWIFFALVLHLGLWLFQLTRRQQSSTVLQDPSSEKRISSIGPVWQKEVQPSTHKWKEWIRKHCFQSKGQIA